MARSSSADLKVPSSLHALLQGTFARSGDMAAALARFWQPQGGARISPVNSCGLRTSTNDADRLMEASWT